MTFLCCPLLLLGVLLLGIVQAHAGLVAHYAFNETSGTTAADSSGYGNTGTLTSMSGTEWTTGKVGGALNFDGINDYVLVGHDSSLNATSALTLAFWIKTTNSQQHVVTKSVAHSGSFTDDSFGLRIQGDGAPAIQISNGSSTPYLNSSQAINDGTWHHVAYVFDRPTSKFYIDGVYDAGGSYTNMANDLYITTEDVYIGASDSVNFGGNPYNFLDGSLDDVRIYNTALSASEVSALAAGTTAAPEPASVFASLGLLSAAGCGLREWRRRKRKAA